jgi:hypothetical protein
MPERPVTTFKYLPSSGLHAASAFSLPLDAEQSLWFYCLASLQCCLYGKPMQTAIHPFFIRTSTTNRSHDALIAAQKRIQTNVSIKVKKLTVQAQC